MTITLTRIDRPGSITLTAPSTGALETLVRFMAGLAGAWRMQTEPDYDAQAEISEGHRMAESGLRPY